MVVVGLSTPDSNWKFGNDGVVTADNLQPCAESDSKDITYLAAIFASLDGLFPQQPRYYTTGFSQNAMFAGYAGVCFADKVQGIAQGKITHLCADKTRQHDDDDNDDDDVLNL